MKKRILLSLLPFIFLFTAACAHTAGTDQPSEVPADTIAVQILFINAGKADSILLSTGEGNYLVDTGKASSAPAILGALNYLDISSLNGVFLTHTHSDHTGGLPLLAETVPVAQLYHAEFTELTKKGVNRFERFSEELSIPRAVLSAGDHIDLGRGVTADVLGPLVPNEDDDNDQSLVLMINAGRRKVLLTGDMQFAEEDTLLSAGTSLSADLLKVGNHGNPDATSEAFAKAVSPSVAVITTDTSVDQDSANPRVLEALENAEIYVTEDYPVGVLAEISGAGGLRVSAADPPPPASLSLRSIDAGSQAATVENNGPEADVSGYMLYSEKGDELFVFPSGTVIPAGGTLTICCEGGDGDLIWGGASSVWSTKKSDTGVLFDRYGRELDRMKAK